MGTHAQHLTEAALHGILESEEKVARATEDESGPPAQYQGKGDTVQQQSITATPILTEIPGSSTGTIPACIYDRASEAGGYVYADKSHYNKLRDLIHRQGGYIAYYIWEDEKGDKESRQGYQQVLNLAKDGKIKIMAIADPARFSRGGSERIQKFELLEKYGVDILRGDTQDYDRAGMRRYQEAFTDNQYLRDQAQKSIDNVPLAIQNGKMPGHTPTGLKRELRLNADNTAVEPVIVHHPVYAPLVQQMARDYIGGMSVRDIVAQLNSDGPPNPNVKGGGKWTINTIYSIFHTYANIGVIKWGRRHSARHIPYSGPVLTEVAKFPPLFDEATWAQLHARLDSNNTGRTMTQQGNPATLLDNILVCQECGHKVYVTSTAKSGHRYYKYVCSQTHRGISKCQHSAISQRVADQAVIDQLLRLRKQPWSNDTFDEAVRSDPYEPVRVKLRAELAQEQQNMKDHARKVMKMDDMPLEMREAMREIADEIALRIRHLQDQLASVPVKMFNAARAKELYDRVAKSDIPAYVRDAVTAGDTVQLKDIISTLVKSATIVERSTRGGTTQHCTLARADVVWHDEVNLLLNCNALTLASVDSEPDVTRKAMSVRERQRHYRQRLAEKGGN